MRSTWLQLRLSTHIPSSCFGVMLHRRSYAWNMFRLEKYSDATYDGTIHLTIVTCAEQVADYIDVHFVRLWREEKIVTCLLEAESISFR